MSKNDPFCCCFWMILTNVYLEWTETDISMKIRIFFKAIPTIDQTVIFRRLGKGVPLPNMSRQKLIVAEKKIPGDVQQYYAPYIFRGKSGQTYFKNI